MKKSILILISLVALVACANKSGSDTAPATTPKSSTVSAKAAPPKAAPPKTAPAPKAVTAKAPGSQPAAAPGSQPGAARTPAPMAKPPNLPAPPDVKAPPADAIKSATGLASKVLKKGTGAKKPTPQDTVTVHYTGWTTDGKMFDSSVLRGQPTTFPLDGVIKGWTEGVALMVVGEKRRLWIPGNLAYGETPTRSGAPVGTLVFDVELMDIQKPSSPEEVEVQFQAFKAAVITAADAVCKCKDMNCVQGTMKEMSKVRPPTGRPTPEHISQLSPYMQRIQSCGQKLQASAGPRPGLPAPTGPRPGARPGAPPAGR